MFYYYYYNLSKMFYINRYGDCSRHCGGGIQSATRDCNSPSPTNGGKYCIGNRIRYRSCNTKDCSKNSFDFREEQCSEYNNNNYDIPGLDKNVKWVPKYGGIFCALFFSF